MQSKLDRERQEIELTTHQQMRVIMLQNDEYFDNIEDTVAKEQADREMVKEELPTRIYL